MNARSRILLIVLSVILSACASSYVVDSEGDQPDSDTSDGICETSNNDCTLRAALMQANETTGSDTITFDNVDTILLNSALPSLTDDSIRIKGGGLVTLDGGQNLDCGGFPGLNILGSSNHVIQGLTILNFGSGIRIDGSNTVAENNIIGVNPGTAGEPNTGNVIGGNCHGVYITGPGAGQNTVAGNIIGANQDGQSANPNGTGVVLINGTHHNVIGDAGSGGFNPVYTADMSAFWPLDEPSGDALDAYGNNDLSETSGSIASANGVIGSARDFEADDSEYFTIADNSALSVGDIDFTISLWINAESISAEADILMKGAASAAGSEYRLALFTDGNMQFTVGSGSTWGTVSAGPGAITPGGWHHILAYHDSVNDEIGLIINDGQSSTSSYSFGSHDTAEPFVLGARSNMTRHFDGLIDEVALWKRALSPQEISSLYNNGNGVVFDSTAAGRNLISGNDVGIHLNTTEYNHISGNLIGTTFSGNAALPNEYVGIRLDEADHNTIGINNAGDGSGNLISANTSHGIEFQGSENNTIAGNRIGTTLDGSAALGNGGRGLFILATSVFNTIGTNGDGNFDDIEGNLISGNGAITFGAGIYLNAPDNVVAGNRIGTNAAGTAALPNISSGITLGTDGHSNRVGTNGDGTSDDLEANLISGNAASGISIGSDFNQVSGNLIGTDISGTLALGNTFSGVSLLPAAQNNLIGTNGDSSQDTAERNIIAGSGGGGNAGVEIQGDNNVVAGNYIGTDITGMNELANQQYGVSLFGGANGNLIGTDGDGMADGIEGNLISGNGRMGVGIFDAINNRVAGNLIGTDASGAGALPNGHLTVELYGAVELRNGASSNVIGTNGDGNGDNSEGNLISGNDHNGVVISGQGTDNNLIAGNYIGVNGNGTAALPNALVGVNIFGGAANNRIGTDNDGISDAAEANVISGNLRSGISINTSSDNVVTGNFIGTNQGGGLMLGNGDHGVNIFASSPGGQANNNWVGGLTLDTGNLIAFNQKSGVQLSGGAIQNPIVYNSIHSNVGPGINLLGPNSGGELYGITHNDIGDGDSGSNDLLNFPELTNALAVNNTVSIAGEIVDGLPNTAFTVQFFANDLCDLGNHGEGQTYIGETVVNTDGSGYVGFLSNFNQSVSAGSHITATATNNSNTSEFSECIEIEGGQQLQGETPEGFNVTPNRNVNCRYACTTLSDIADTLLEGVMYVPLGYDPETGYFMFEGPSFGETCYAAPVAGGTELMALDVDGLTVAPDEIASIGIELFSCPDFSTPTPTLDPDESYDATPTPLPQCSDGIDNDGDGLIDYVAPGAAGAGGDRECSSAQDNDESR